MLSVGKNYLGISKVKRNGICRMIKEFRKFPLNSLLRIIDIMLIKKEKQKQEKQNYINNSSYTNKYLECDFI